MSRRPWLPSFACAPGCSACCRMRPVPVSRSEKEAISALRPDLEWREHSRPADPEEKWIMTAHEALGRCPLLGPKGCTIHETDAYPLICRAFGVIKHPAMTCHYGGEASAKIEERDAKHMMRRHYRRWARRYARLSP